MRDPRRIRHFASVFLVLVMLVFVVSSLHGGSGKTQGSAKLLFPPTKSFSKCTKMLQRSLKALPVPSANAAAEKIRQAITDGALLRAR